MRQPFFIDYINMAKEFLNVSVDVENAQKALSSTSKSLKSISRQTLGIIGRTTAKAVKDAVRSSDMNRDTGEMLKAYRYKVKKDGSSVTVFPKAITSKESEIFPKTMALSYGTYKGVQNAHKAFRFVQKGNEFVESGAYMDEVNKMIQKQLDKYWG